MAKAKHRWITVTCLVVALLLGACGGRSEPTVPDDAPTSDDVSDRQRVPEIRLVTKTQAEDPTRYEMARLIVDSWRAAGIEASLLPVGTTQLNSMTATAKDYDVYIISYDGIPERLDPDNLLSRFTSSNATKTGSNISLYESAEFDQAYLTQLRADAEQERLDAVREAQRILHHDLPVAPLVYPSTGSAYRSDRWSGMEITPSTPLFGTWNAVHAAPVDGRTELVVGTTIDPSTLNPVLATQNQDLRPLQLVYDTPLAFNPAGDLIENAASDWSVDGKEIRLTLNDHLTFTDGEPVTGEDVAFSITYMKEQGAPLFAPALQVVERVEADGPDVIITLQEPSASFPAVVLSNLPILPRHIWSSYADASRAGQDDLVGSGPFRLTGRSSGQAITFTRNPDFRQPPNVEKLRMLILGSFDAAAGALQSGQIDIINPAETVSSQYDQIEGAAGIEVVHTDSHGWRGLHYNTTRGPLQHRGFRQALTALAPINDLVEVAHQGRATPAGSVIAPALPGWHDDTIEPFEYDLKTAMKALRDAGFVYGPDGDLYAPASESGANDDVNPAETD